MALAVIGTRITISLIKKNKIKIAARFNNFFVHITYGRVVL